MECCAFLQSFGVPPEVLKAEYMRVKSRRIAAKNDIGKNPLHTAVIQILNHVQYPRASRALSCHGNGRTGGGRERKYSRAAGPGEANATQPTLRSEILAADAPPELGRPARARMRGARP